MESVSRTKIEYPAKWIVGLCVADIITTVIGLKIGAKETNQLALLIGIGCFLAIKFIATITLTVIVVLRDKGNSVQGSNVFTKPINAKWLWIAVCLMGIVVISNLIVISVHLIGR